MAVVLVQISEPNIVTDSWRTLERKLNRGRSYWTAGGSRIWRDRNPVDFIARARIYPHPQVRPVYCRIQIGVEGDTVLPLFLIRQDDAAQVPVGQVPEVRVLKDVVAVPFDDGPVKLLPPCPGNREPGGAGVAECGNGRWLQKVTLQVPVRPQLLKLV